MQKAFFFVFDSIITMAPMPTDPAEARKRRKEIIQSQRSEGDGAPAAGAAAEPPAPKGGKAKIKAATEKKPPKKRKVTAEDDTASAAPSKKAAKATTSSGNSSDSDKKKTQIRYDPEVPMNKEQLAAWRREARRVRNRESAAASRQRIRNRISELEDEVNQWKSKYSQAMQRLEALEAAVGNKNGAAAASASV